MKMNFGVVLQGRSFTPNLKEIKGDRIKGLGVGLILYLASDHLMHPFSVRGKPDFYCHETWTLMSALAALI